MTTTFSGKWHGSRIAEPLSEQFLAYAPKDDLSFGCEVAPGAFWVNHAGLRCLHFLDEIVVTGRAEAMCQTASDGIDAGCVSIGLFAEPAACPCLPIVMHEPTEMTDQKYRDVRFRVRIRHI